MTLVPNKRKIAYYYDVEIGNFYFGPGHPMKPNRVRMTHTLISEYKMYKKMEIYRPYALSENEMTLFHADDYIHFLQNVSVDNQKSYEIESTQFLGKAEHSDCPVFDGMFKFCQLYAGASVGAAVKLNHSLADVVINWSGGLHHAKRAEAAGFCYVNDIVLAILELLKFHARVLYIDIDVHHGDGVEEAFYATNRVMTLSFHKGGDFFPGTGRIEDFGIGEGKYYSLNFPLNDGMDDETFFSVFQPTVDKVVEHYQPGAIVLQCGADSLSGDRLGCFNLTCKGHGKCVEHVLDKNVPTLVLGGGGYTVRNVARCWTYETSVCLGIKLDDIIPFNQYIEYFGPDYKLHIQPSEMVNSNSRSYLDSVKVKIFECLRQIPNSPSVSFHKCENSNLPLVFEEREKDPEVRVSMAEKDKEVVPDNELFDGDKDHDNVSYRKENGGLS